MTTDKQKLFVKLIVRDEDKKRFKNIDTTSLKHNEALKLDSQILPNLKKDNGLTLTSSAYESVSLPGLVFGSTDNTMLGKVILALAAITTEIDFLGPML